MDLKENTAREVARRLAAGCERLTLAGLLARAAALGYVADRTSDARGLSRIMTGPGAGDTYPACGLYALQADNRMSAFHVDARRDANFRDFQRLRMECFAVVRGMIYEF